MDNINYDDFENICRTCLLTCDHTFLQDRVISDVYYKCTETRWDLKDELPQQICLKCYEKIIEMHAFSLQCKQVHSSLMKSLTEFKNLRIKEDPNIQETSEYDGIKDEITIEEHKIEFIKEEENDINKLQKQKNVGETSDELRFVPETDEINNDPNIISVQDDCNENVGNEKTLDEDTNQNDLNEDTNLESTDSTSIKEVSNEIRADPYKCDLCPKTFKFKRFLNTHKKKHCVKRPLLCTMCNKTFKYLSLLNKHKCIQRVECSYVCDICDKTCITSSDLNIHKRIHSDKGICESKNSNKTFIQSISLRDRNVMRSSERPIKCKICNISFNHSENLIAHKRNIHSDERPYECEICNKTFNRLDHLKGHIRIHSGERPYECEICNKTFNRSDHLKGHIRIHSGERPYECEICNKTFNQASNLIVHKRIHNEERPYKCKICNKTFNQLHHFNVHKRTHSGERPYNCEICNKIFYQASDLNKHKRIHSGERPYVCEICNKAFKRSHHLKDHKRIHSNERNINRKSLESASGSKTYETVNNGELPYKCDVCLRSYKRLSLLQGHKKTHNPNLNDSDDTSK